MLADGVVAAGTVTFILVVLGFVLERFWIIGKPYTKNSTAPPKMTSTKMITNTKFEPESSWVPGLLITVAIIMNEEGMKIATQSTPFHSDQLINDIIPLLWQKIYVAETIIVTV